MNPTPHHRPKDLTQEQWRDWVDGQLAAGAERFEALAAQSQTSADLIEANTALTAQIKADTSEIVTSWKAMSGFVKVMNVVGKVGTWAIGIGTFFGGIWALFHFGAPPK